MSTPLTGPDAEEYIKEQIKRDFKSRDILSALLQVDVPSTYEEISQLEAFRALNLSDEFITNWLFYPSGREIPSQIFITFMEDESPNVPLLMRDANGWFIQKDNGVRVNMPCLGVVNEFFYAPLTGDDVLLSTCSSYEYEPNSFSLYSTKGKQILFAPDYDMAIYYFLREWEDESLEFEYLSTGYPGLITENILESLGTRYQEIQDSLIPCEPTANPLILPQIGRYMVCNVMRGYELVVVGDEFIAPHFNNWVRRSGVPFFSFVKKHRITDEQRARAFVQKKGFTSIEDYLEYLFSLGVHPRAALEDLMSDISINNVPKYGNLESPARDDDHIRIKNRFNLSPEFLRKWFIYPSGRIFGRFKYLEDVRTINLSTVRHLIPRLNVLTRPGFLVEPYSLENPAITLIGDPVLENLRVTPAGDPIITPIPCMFFDNQPLYIPVLRYERRTEYSDTVYCGTYYYFDEGPQLYLKSNKTLIAPNFGHAYFHLKGYNLDELGGYNSKPRPEEEKRRAELSDREFKEMVKNRILEDIRHESQHCEPSDYRDVLFEGGEFEKDLCRLARSQGYNVIISTYSFKRRTNISEIMDTRPRSEAYSHLYRIE